MVIHGITKQYMSIHGYTWPYIVIHGYLFYWFVCHKMYKWKKNYLSCHGEEAQGSVRLGNPDLDFQNLNLDFPIKREIRKRISGWISIKKSKSGFFGFPFLSFDWEIRKRIYKTILVNSGLLSTNYACACKTAVPKDSFANPFSDFRFSGKTLAAEPPSREEKWTMQQIFLGNLSEFAESCIR